MKKKLSGISLTGVIRSAKICVTVVIVYFTIKAFNYMYVYEDPWYRILWRHYYEDEGSIDHIYLGSSHVYCDINPQQLDKQNGLYHFNLSTPGQLLNGSYFLLKEAERGNSLSHVYLELYYMCSTEDNFNENMDPIFAEADYQRNWQNTDFMKFSDIKLAYMFSIGGSEACAGIWLPFSRYRASLDDWNYVRETIEKKRDKDYYNDVYHLDFEDGYDEYTGQGYLYSTRSFADEERLFAQSRILDRDPLGTESEKYIRRIISYCQKRRIPISLFISPMNELQLISTEGYDNYINQIKKIAEEYGVRFCDFNLVKEEYLPIQEGRYFRDIGHLNGKGADLYTSFFYDVMENGKMDEKYFHSSYKEKLEESAPAVYGLYYRDSEVTEENPEQSRMFHIASNRDEEIEYQITILPGDEEPYILQKFDSCKVFSLPPDVHGKCRIESRMVQEKDCVLHTLEINI